MEPPFPSDKTAGADRSVFAPVLIRKFAIAFLKRHLKTRCCRAAMLRIGPTIYSHTPYARVHSAFPPLFEGAIRQRAMSCMLKTTLF